MTKIKTDKDLTTNKDFQRKGFVFSALILPTIGFLVFFVYVNARSVLMAFERPEYTDVGLIERFSFDNFGRMFGANGGLAQITEALVNTLYFFAADLIIVFPISIVMSYFFFKKILGYRFFRFVYYLPSIISSSVLVALFKYAVGPGGVIAAIQTAQNKDVFYLLANESSAMLTILFYNVMFSFGGNIIIIGGSMNGTSADVLEAGEIDGCNRFQELTKLIIPMMWPTLSTMIILKTAAILSATGPILAFTKGANGTMTLSYLLYALVSGQGQEKDLYYASAVGLVMTLAVFPIAMLIKHFVYGEKREAEDTI